MGPVDLQVIGRELAVRWDDHAESFIPLETLRRHCPCAGCRGEVDVMGNLHRSPTPPLSAQAFELRRLNAVGSYALQPIWGDGHDTGLYTFEYLRRIADTASAPGA